jgi:hypothetical protein
MSTSARPRERLLDAAGELFYRDGVNTPARTEQATGFSQVSGTK